MECEPSDHLIYHNCDVHFQCFRIRAAGRAYACTGSSGSLRSSGSGIHIGENENLEELEKEIVIISHR